METTWETEKRESLQRKSADIYRLSKLVIFPRDWVGRLGWNFTTYNPGGTDEIWIYSHQYCQARISYNMGNITYWWMGSVEFRQVSRETFFKYLRATVRATRAES